MGAATAGAGALTAVTGAIQTFDAMATKKKVANEIKNMKDNPLTNIADGMQVSTLGADLQREEAARLSATQTSALQDGGTRALLGGLGRVTARNQDVNAQIGANLDEQQKQIDQVAAQDQANIRSIKEQRQMNKLAALSSQYNAANQGITQGIANVVQGAGTAGNAFSNMKKDKIDPTTGK